MITFEYIFIQLLGPLQTLIARKVAGGYDIRTPGSEALHQPVWIHVTSDGALKTRLEHFFLSIPNARYMGARRV